MTCFLHPRHLRLSAIRIPLLLIISVLVVSSCSSDTKDPGQPNIVIINVDDMGWRDVGFMGSDYYETPAIDGLAERGMVFTNGYAAASNCAPSRACLMTGQWTPRHGIYTVGSSERGHSKYRKLVPTKNTTVLAEREKIIPEILRKNGYTTCHAGKWHLSKNPLEYGFEVNIGGSQSGHPRSYYPPYKNVILDSGQADYLTDLIMEKTLEFVDTVSAPFFLYYAPYAVHTPIHPVKQLLDKYEQKPGSNGQENAKYATMVENLDRNIGLLLSALEKKGHFQNTFIVFTSDNGGLYGITKQPPLRAGKGSYYEGGIREPFVFVYEERIAAQSESEVPITNLDIFPTLLHYAGIASDSLEMDGKDLSSILEGKTDQLDRHLLWHFPVYLQAYNASDNENRDSLFRTRPGSVIRYGDWKLHYYFEDEGMELYNLARDIGERNNLATEEPRKKEEMLNLLKTWWKEVEAPIPTALNPGYEE